MLKNYLVIAIRNVLKHRGYSLLNLAGLAAGLTCCIFVALFVREDIAYDSFHTKRDRIARVLTIDNAQGVSSQFVGVSYPALGPALVQEVPEIVDAVRIVQQGRPQLTYGEKTVKAESVFLTESSFFTIFDFPIIRGARTAVLDEPYSVVLTESFAKKIFGSEDAVGKTLMFNKTRALHVKAVMKDPPPTSHLQFDMLHSLQPPDDQPGWAQWISSWSGISLTNYVLLDKPRNVQSINPKLKQIAVSHGGVEFFTPILQPLGDVHLRSAGILFEQNAHKGDISNVYVLTAIAFFIALLASINFMNLVTARSALRAREVGMRKAVGATRTELIVQHLCESLVITVMAGLVAIGLVEILLPILNALYGRQAEFALFSDPFLFIGLPVLILVVGLLSGSYPAFVLSAYKPAVVLKGTYGTSRGGVLLRRILVVFQFTVSIALITATVIVQQQMEYIQTANLGYQREQVMTIPFGNADIVSRGQALRTELEQNTNVLTTATSAQQIGVQYGRTVITPEGISAADNYIVSITAFDESYVPTLGMTIKEGRNFSTEFPADTSNAVLINEELAAMFHWDEPIGKTITLGDGQPDPSGQPAQVYTVVGVVSNFHFATMHHKVEPLMMLCSHNNNVLSVKISADNVPQTVQAIEKAWKQVNPSDILTYSFLDDDYNQLYERDTTFTTMVQHFTALAIGIACLGLFGLSAFSIQQRRKEIGIRKVLGAPVKNIALLLGIDFLRWVLLANIFAWPIAYFGAQLWLEDFVYHISLDVVPFVVAGGTSLLIAVGTVSWQAVRAALANPVRTLRYE